MDNFHKNRTIIAEKMIGNLKEACNKFIANKFPMSAIRSVNVYIVKSKLTQLAWTFGPCATPLISITK